MKLDVLGEPTETALRINPRFSQTRPGFEPAAKPCRHDIHADIAPIATHTAAQRTKGYTISDTSLEERAISAD